MEKVNYVPGKLKLKGKTKKKKSCEAKKEEEKPKKLLVREYNHPDHLVIKPINPTSNKFDPDSVIDQLTDAELKALAVRNKSTKRIIEKTNSISYHEQKEKLNQLLKSYPLHNDLEGD